MITPSETLKQNLDNLVVDRLVTVRKQNGLSIYKYSKKAFFKNLWNQYPDLKEARGIVLDDRGNLISYPFTKIFNYGENGAALPLNEDVVATDKINGYLGVVSIDPTTNELLMTTSGSFESEYVDDFKNIVGKVEQSEIHDLLKWKNDFTGVQWTLMFEVISPDHHHSVIGNQTKSLWFIGMRANFIGSPLMDEEELDDLKDVFLRSDLFRRPKHQIIPFFLVVDKTKDPNITIEGWVCRPFNTKSTDAPVKIKARNYLQKKFLSRTKKDLSFIWNNKNEARHILPEEFYDVIEELPELVTFDSWNDMSNEQKVEVLQKVLP